MRRRDFINLLGVAAAAWPVAGRAQPLARTPTVGMLAPGTTASHGKWIEALVARLNELGWSDGRDIKFEYRWANGRDDRVAEIAAEFVQLNVDVIVTSSNQAVKTVMNATSRIPIVVAAMTDPTETGIVKTLARPGGNVTGLAQQTSDLVGKRFELLQKVVPVLPQIAVMGYSPAPNFPLEIDAAHVAAAKLGIGVTIIELRQPGDIPAAFESLKGRAQGLYLPITPFISVNQGQLNSLALAAQLPTVHGLPEYVKSGGLMSYGADFVGLFRRAGDFVDRILRGTDPAELPVEQPTKFDLVINIRTAKALGITIPTVILATCDELIE